MTLKWQSDISLDEAARATRPRLATTEGITTAGADRPIVATLTKEAAGSEDVLEWTAIDADFQHAAVKSVLQNIIVAENQRSIFKDIDPDRRRVEMLIANRIRIVNPRGIWRRVGRRAGISGIRRLPEYPIRVITLPAVHPGGRAGGVTLSKFSNKKHAIGVGVGVGVAQGVSVYCWLSLVGVPGPELPATA